MKVFYTRTYNLSGANAGKQQNIATIADRMGFEEIAFFRFEDACDTDAELNVRMDGIMAALEENAVIIFQYPSMVSSRYDRCVVEHIRQFADRRLIIMVQDLGSVIDENDYPVLEEEIQLFQQADLLILQSPLMKKFLEEHGLENVPVMYQQVWEYPYEIYNDQVQIRKDIQYVKDCSIPAMLEMQTSGIAVLGCNGSFYETMCTPLETGFCICAGIPAVTDQKSVVSQFLLKYGIGFVVEEMQPLESFIQSLTDEQIQEKTDKIRKIKEMVGNGWFTKTLLQNAVFQVLEENFHVKNTIF